MSYGYKARFGFIHPTVVGEIFFYEFYKIVPEGYTQVGASLTVRRLTENNVSESVAAAQELAKELALHKPNVICIAGSPVLAIHSGSGKEQSLPEMVTKATGIPSFIGQEAEVKALRKLGLKKLAIATPWKDDGNAPLVKYLSDSGFQVRALKGGWVPVHERGMLSLSVSYNRAVEAFREAGDADGVYLPCGNWPATGNIAALEKELKVPVVTTVQAMIWGCFHEIGLHEHITNYGRLLEDI